MGRRPTIRTERLVLRPFRRADAEDVRRLAGDREIALNTLRIPHPYEEGVAEAWIASQQESFDRNRGLALAVEGADDGALVGAVGLEIEVEHSRAELGYWIGRPYWGRGYATEAAAAVVRYGIEQLKLNRIFACCFTRNAASQRVLAKLGMTCEGTSRQHVIKWGEVLDMGHYAILREDHERAGRR